ncbi:MAG: hypothetical protein IPM47_02515 [Sphingobacteriales bacterium]|nr:MAG: hypothetical protein IPM47_02515 [Sphingobacteriales bacterium]
MNIFYKGFLNYGLLLTAILTSEMLFGQAPCPPTVVTVPYIGGKVFLDYGQDGAFNTGIDQPISGVTISVYSASNTLVGTATSTADGNYIFESASMTNGSRYRLEFTNGPTEYEQTFAGTDSKTSVQFATASGCNINFGLMDPVLYCQTDPRFATNRFVEGNNSGTDNVIVSVAYNAAASANESNDPSLSSPEAVANVLGTTLGLAYQRSSKNLFVTAYMRRFTGFGPGGPGAIYRVPNPHDGLLSGSLFVNLNTLFGSSVAGTDPHNFTTQTSGGDVIDANAFNQVGRVSFGDLDISDDELSLWAVNLNDRSLYRIPLGSDPTNPVAPTLSSQVTVIPLASVGSPLPNLPSGITNAEIRPFGLKFRKGKVYIGLVTNGQDGGPIRGLVYSYDIVATTFTKELDFSLVYNRGCGFGLNSTCYGPATWQPWLNSNVWPTPTVSSSQESGYPQPMLTDIEFDAAGNMILALRDRWGDQGGRSAPQPNSPFTLRTSDAFGDLLMATKNTGAGWTLNIANFTDPSTASGTSEPWFGNDNYGPEDGYYHEETGMGGLAVLMRQNTMVVPVMDSRTAAFTNGVDWYNLAGSGLPRYKSITLLSGAANPFGKAHGLGEVELLCDLAPLEIGNFVWLDSNLNGIQDPAETAIANVSLELYTDPNGDGNPADGTLVGTTTTNSTGNYYFNSSNVNLNGATGLLPNTNYTVQVGSSDWFSGAGIADLLGYQLTLSNIGGAGQPNVRDNDAALIAARPRVPATLGTNGKTDHTFDIGFRPVCNLSAVGSGTNVSCNGGSNGTATVTVSGNLIPVTYLWSTGATTQSITGLAVGTYSVTVTETVECTAVASYVVTQPPVLSLSRTITNVLCFGNSTGAINLTVTGGTSPYTYNWGGGVTTEDRTGLAAGTYTVTVTDANGCTGTSSATVTQPAAALSLSRTITNVLCFGNSTGAINLTVTGGTSPYTYNWGGGITTEDRTGLAAGTYTVTVTDTNGCTGTSSATVTQPAAALSLSTSVTNVLCFGNSTGAINLTVTGGTSPYTYNWGGGVTTEDRTGLAAGTYNVTVTDANNCTAVTSATVTQPAAALSLSRTITNVLCFGNSTGAINLTVTGGTSPYTYNWGGGITTEDRTGLAAGTYTVTVTDTNGCTGTSSATVTQPAAALSLSTSVTNVLCFGNSTGAINLTVSGGTSPYTYSWAGGVTTEDRTGLAAGTYTVTVTDANNCTAVTSATVTQPAAGLSLSTSVTNVLCFGNSTGAINLTVSGGTSPYTYSWAGGVTTEDRTGLAAGTYNVTVTDANNCTAVTSATVTQPAAALSLSTIVTDVLCFGNSTGAINLTVTGGTSPYTYSWGGGVTTEDRTGLAAGTYNVTVTDANNCTAVTSATVTQPAAALSLSTIVTDVLCFGNSTGAINLTVTGGTSPYTYSWAGGVTTEDRTGLAAGTYTVTVTDANNCTAVTSATVTQPAAGLSLSTSVTNVLCFGNSTGAINLTVSGGTSPYTYSWAGGATTEDRTGLAVGTYTVTVTDANNCTAVTSATVTQPAAGLSLSTIVTDVLCFGNSTGAINLTVSGGTSPYTYNWAGGVTTEDRTGLAAGTYTVTVTDANNCTAVTSATVTQPAAGLSLSTIVTDVLCFGNSTGAINLTVSGGTSPYTYSWAGGATTEDRTGLAAGTYTVTVTDANNCTAVTSATVTQPAAALSLSTSVTDVLCFGNSTGAINLTVTGGTSPYTYNWGGGVTTEDLTGLAAGTYTVTVTDANNCTAVTSATVNQPPVLAVSTTMTPVLCNGGPTGGVNLTVSGGTTPYSYLWSNGATTEDISGVVAGTYTVTVTDANNCTAVTSETVTQPLELLVTCSKVDVSITNGSDGAANASVSGGTTPYTYLWSNGATTSEITGITVGTYTVTVTDANNCTTSCTTTLTEPPCGIVLNISAEDALCNGDANGSIDLTITGTQGAVSILWNDGATTEDRTGLTAGTYSVTVTDEGECTATISVTVDEPEVLSMTGTVTNVTITNGNDGTINVSVTGGTTPYSYLWSDGATTQDRTGLPAGTYSVTVTDANDCADEASFTLTEPPCGIVLNISAEDALCNGDANGSIDLTITGTQGSVSILWNDGATSEDRTGLTAGTYSVTVTDEGECTATISVTVDEPEVLSMTGTVTNVTITNGSDGTINVSVTGGTTPYSYIWSDGATTQDRTGLPAGTYSVTVTDANDCADEASFTLTEPPCGIVLNISAEDALCNGDANGSIDLTITGTQGVVSILWNDGATTEDRTGLVAGTYSVTVTDEGECTATISVTVDEPEVLSMTGTVTNVTITNGNDGTINVSVTGGTTPYSYLWSDGATTQDRTGLTAGTYSVTVTDANDCADEASFTLTEPPCGIVLNISAEDALCNGDANGSIDLTITGTQGSVSILWNDGATTEDRTGLTAGTYSVTVTDEGECTATISVTVDEPEVLSMTGTVTNVTITNGNDGTINVSVTGGTTPYSYLWSDGATTQDRTGLVAGTYSVTVTDANDCADEASFTLTEPPCGIVLNISAEDALCNGDANGSIDLTITGTQGAVSILWNDGATTEDRTGLVAGTYSVTVTDEGECTATISVSVDEPEVLSMTGTVTNVTITNGSDGTINVSVTGGTTPYSYFWSDGATTQDRTGLTAGTYSVTVTDANDCADEASFTLTEPPCGIVLNISAEDALCNGDANGSIDLTITGTQGAVSILWNDGATTEDRTGLTAGTYSVTVTDEGECTATISVTVDEPEVLSMTGTVTNVTITNGSDGTINVTVTGGTTPYSYLWSDGATTQDRTGLPAGTYSVTVTDANDCADEASFTLTEPPCGIVLNISAEDALCNGDANGSIDLTITGTQGAVSILWNDGATTEDRTGLTAGTYSVTVTDEGECTATISVTVDEPEVLSMTGTVTNVTITNGNDGTINVSVTGGTTPYSYLWSDGATTQDRTGLTAGTYSVTVTDANDCADEASFTLTEPPCGIVLNISAEDALCNGDANGSIDLTITGTQGAVSILWNDGATTEDRTGLTAGTYSVTVTDEGECTATISVTVDEPEVLSMTGTVTNVTITNGSDGTINVSVTGGTTPYSYLWSDGATTQDRTGLTAGTYSVTVTDANDCADEASFTLTEPPCGIVLNISAEDALCNGDANGSIDLTITGTQGSVSILWNDGATTEDRTGLSAGTYSVTVTDEGECTATISVTVDEPEVLNMTGTVTNVTITNGSDGTINVSVTGGTTPYSYLWSDGATTQDRTGLPAGTYSVTVTDANDCADEASFTLTEPPCGIVLNISAEDALCNGDANGSIDLTITGTQGAVSILWNDGATTEDRTGLTAGTYSVTVTDEGECTATISVTVDEPEVLSMTGTVTNVTITNGNDGTINVSVTGGTTPYSYIWSDGATTQDRTGLTAGTYSVTVTDANDCADEASFTLTEPPCGIVLNISAEDALCNGDANGSIDLTITGTQGAVSILWNDGATTEDRTGLTAGTYSVTVTDEI